MDVKFILNLISVLETGSNLIANWTKTASPEAVKALIAEAHAQGKTIDMDAVNAAFDRVRQSGADLDAAIAAAKAGDAP